jgi:hypothetical protein
LIRTSLSLESAVGKMRIVVEINGAGDGLSDAAG